MPYLSEPVEYCESCGTYLRDGTALRPCPLECPPKGDT